MLFRYFYLVFTVILLTYTLKAQSTLQDTIIRIEEININTSRLNNFALGTSIETISSDLINKNNSRLLTEIFTSLTGMSVKTYGLGGLSTLSIRGADASHTAVIWNGLNIQSPMNGIANLSTVPAFLVSDITIQQGGSGTLFGSGAVGGVVHISSFKDMNIQNNVTFQAGYGSFNRQEYLFSAKTGDDTYAFSLKIYKRSADNDFAFKNSTKPENPKETQTNAGSLNYGFMPDLQVKTSKKSVLSISALYQKYSKDIQTLMTAYEANIDNQADNNLFFSTSWKYSASKYSVNVKSGIINSKLVLTDQSLPDPDDSPLSVNKANSFINEIEGKLFITDNQIINAGINLTSEKGESTNYQDSVVNRNRFAFFSSYKVIDLYKGLNAVFSLRKEFDNINSQPFTFSIGSDYDVNGIISLKGNISRNYKIPTLNDLYWKADTYSSGNPDLQPESGYSGEFSVIEKTTVGDVGLDLSQTFFATSINDWIVWLPNEENIWIPTNKEKGKSKGIELRGEGTYKKENSTVILNAFYSLTSSKLSSTINNEYQPMLYVPENRFMASLNYSYKKFSCLFSFNYVGERYYDNINTLPNYKIGDLALYYDIPINDHNLRAAFRINNLWDTEYQAMAWYAMPLRNFQFSLNLRINTVY
ncbi:MAG: TonB-dependent receptor [Prolixibacteraceae bacterium]|nr:TonB-dependent receptor [Prolixibacteraceae bacterium]